MQDLIENAEKQPNITIGVLVAIAVVILSVILKVLFGGKKKVFSYYALLLISEMDSLTHQKGNAFYRYQVETLKTAIGIDLLICLVRRI